MPPLFTSSPSGNGRFHPPSLVGVESHNRRRWRLGLGGAKSVYAVLAWKTWATTSAETSELQVGDGTYCRLRIEYPQQLEPCGVIIAERHPRVLE
jgi:hypothetical protein